MSTGGCRTRQTSDTHKKTSNKTHEQIDSQVNYYAALHTPRTMLKQSHQINNQKGVVQSRPPEVGRNKGTCTDVRNPVT